MNLRDREAVHDECEDWGEDRVQAYVDAHLDDAERVHRLEWLNLKARAANKQVTDREWAEMSPEIERAIKLDFGHSGIDPLQTRQERAGAIRKFGEVCWGGRHHEMTQPPTALP
jgi:hypothetical protein